MKRGEGGRGGGVGQKLCSAFMFHVSRNRLGENGRRGEVGGWVGEGDRA